MVGYRFVLGRFRRAQDDETTMRKFGPKVTAFIKLQNDSWASATARSYGLRRRRPDPNTVAASRTEMLLLVPTVKSIASRLSVQDPGRHILPLGSLDVLIREEFIHATDAKAVEDVTTQLLALSEAELNAAKRSIRNPLIWIRDAVALIVRLPLYVLELAGYDPSKAQAKLVWVLVRIVWVSFVVGVLLWLGFRRADIPELVKTLGL